MDPIFGGDLTRADAAKDLSPAKESSHHPGRDAPDLEIAGEGGLQKKKTVLPSHQIN